MLFNVIELRLSKIGYVKIYELGAILTQTQF